MSELPQIYDHYQEYEYSGFEPYLFPRTQLIELYQSFARLSLVKTKISNLSNNQISIDNVSCLETAILTALSQQAEDTLIVNTFPNFLPEVIRKSSLNQIKKLFQGLTEVTSDWQFFQQELRSKNILPLYLSDIKSHALVESLIAGNKLNQPLLLVELLDFNRLNNLVKTVRLLQKSSKEFQIFLINQEDNPRARAIVNDLLAEQIKEVDLFISNSQSCLEIAQFYNSSKNKQQVVIFNQSDSINNQSENDYFYFFERSLIQRGLMTIEQVSDLKSEISNALDSEMNISLITEEDHLGGAMNIISEDNKQMLSEIKVARLFSDRELEVQADLQLNSRSILELCEQGLTSDLRIKIAPERIQAGLVGLIMNLSDNYLIHLLMPVLSGQQPIIAQSLEVVIESEPQENALIAFAQESDAYRYKGEDITILTWGNGLEQLSEIFLELDCSPEVILIEQLWPFDASPVVKSVKKTNSLLIIPDSNLEQGLVDHYVSAIFREVYQFLDAPIEIAEENILPQIETLLAF